jgi:hypothetical protein
LYRECVDPQILRFDPCDTDAVKGTPDVRTFPDGDGGTVALRDLRHDQGLGDPLRASVHGAVREREPARLNTDYIDLLLLHWPNRAVSTKRPEVIAAALVMSGSGGEDFLEEHDFESRLQRYGA